GLLKKLSERGEAFGFRSWTGSGLTLALKCQKEACMVPHAWVSSRHFIDSRVQNHNNEVLGHVREIFLDIATGHIDCVLVGCGGIMGLGEKIVAVPWSELQPTYGDQALIWEKSKAEVA